MQEVSFILVDFIKKMNKEITSSTYVYNISFIQKQHGFISICHHISII